MTNHGQLIYVPRAHSCLAHRRPGEPSSWELRRTQAQVHAGNPVQMSEMCCVCLAAQSCLTLWDPMDCSPPGSSVHGDSPGKNIGVGCHALLQGIFPTQGLNPGLPHCRRILYQLSHKGSPTYSRHLCLIYLAQLVKNPPAMQETQFDSWVGKILWRRESLHTPVFWLGESHGQRSLAGCSLWDRKELAMTERLTLTIDRSAYCLIRACGFCL